ncbi:MAG TPA: sigma-70 family RNA polymerase sigma factor [Candidatus Krumholzibacteria bacterium]|nr:sigma-70 family RNA polymerase sigma factor [Candidatus Krumholzibacteria bacterium]
MNATTYTRLLDEHRDRVFARALYVLRDREDAEDVTQEAFLRLWRQGDEVDPERVAGWLTRVVHNLCIDQTRRRKVVRTHFGQPDTEAAELLPVESPHAAPDWGLRLDERQRRLLDAMATLPVETRDVMMMHYFQGRRLQDIAADLGKTESAVKVQVHRARKSLRAVLDRDAEGELLARRQTG